MKTLLQLIISFTFIGCAVPKPVPKPPTWTQPSYVTCDFTVLNLPPHEIGFTLLRTDLAYRYDGFSSMRAYIIKTDGLHQRISNFQNDYQTTETFNGFSEDGRLFLNRIWEDPENAMWELAAKNLIFSADSYRADVLAVDPVTFAETNLTADSQSFYNVSVFKLPGHLLGFGSMINGAMQPYKMNLDGSNKQPLTTSGGFAYGFKPSPDGTKYAFHSDYKVFIGDFATGIEHQVITPCAFNFLPTWSQDSQHIAFFCGASNIGPDIWIADRDGHASFLTGREGFSGAVPIVDGPDFHGGGSDNLAWAGDTLIYAALKSGSVELFQMDINTHNKLQLTNTPAGSFNYAPDVSPDSVHLLFNSSRSGRRNIYYLNLNSLVTKQIIDVNIGCGVYGPKWKDF